MPRAESDAILRHATAWYDYLLERATMQVVPGYAHEVAVFEGRVLEAFDEAVGKSKRGMYSVTSKALVSMGCVDKRVSGARSTHSEWVLLERPTATMWDAIGRRAGLRGSAEYGTKQVSVDDLHVRLHTLEVQIMNHEDRIRELENPTEGEHHG